MFNRKILLMFNSAETGTNSADRMSHSARVQTLTYYSKYMCLLL